jgi:hypothetical protein
VNSQLRTADSGGNTATNSIRATRPLLWRRWCGLLWQISLVSLLAACGVQAPPRPPRVEVPETIKDLSAFQIGRTIHLEFTMPVLATDGEGLNKPVTIDIFRAVAAAGQQSGQPDTSGAAWRSLLPKDLPAYLHAGKVNYPVELSPEEFRQQQGSVLSFAVVTFTHGFRGHMRRSSPSNVVSAALLDVTQPVANLEAKTSQTELRLTWDKPTETLTGLPPEHVSGYRVYQSATGKPGSFQFLGTAASNHFEDTNFQFGTQYFFRVSAVTTLNGATAESEPSAPVSLTPRDVFPPPVPTGLTAVNAAGAVDLLWNATTAPDLAGYNVYRSTDGGMFERINKQIAPTPIFHDQTVAAGNRYQYAVTAVDLSGNESEKSQPASITTPVAGAQ